MDHGFYKWKSGNLVLDVRTVPRASRNHLGKVFDDRLKVYITASPVDGKANRYLCKFLGKQFQVPPTHIKILTGKTSGNKKILIPTPAKVPDIINPDIAPDRSQTSKN